MRPLDHVRTHQLGVAFAMLALALVALWFAVTALRGADGGRLRNDALLLIGPLFVARYQERVGDFLARPSEVRLHRVAETPQLGDRGPMEPRRAD
jgi:hypothetical protein